MTMLPHYLRIFFSLIVIGVILYVIYYILTIFPTNKSFGKKNSKRMQLIEQLFVNPGVFVYLVKVDSQEFLMGVSNKTINFLNPLGVAESPKDFAKILNEKSIEMVKPKRTGSRVKPKETKDGSS